VHFLEACSKLVVGGYCYVLNWVFMSTEHEWMSNGCRMDDPKDVGMDPSRVDKALTLARTSCVPLRHEQKSTADIRASEVMGGLPAAGSEQAAF
jgi:hypothetical protein